jgi:hypothetical protein
MREDRVWPEEHVRNVTVIKAFEEYEELIETDFGSDQTDFMQAYEIFYAGFLAGGQNG